LHKTKTQTPPHSTDSRAGDIAQTRRRCHKGSTNLYKTAREAVLKAADEKSASAARRVTCVSALLREDKRREIYGNATRISSKHMLRNVFALTIIQVEK
jgi:hypothetical protein